jgi:hypothetical protein
MEIVDDHKDRFERMKLLFDLNKHITTLATGTMLLMAGFYERVFKSPTWKELAAATFVLFAATVLCSVLAMFSFAMYSQKTHNTPDDPIERGAKFFTAALSALILGVMAFVMFVLKNL